MILILVALVACVLAGLWTYARWNFGTLERMGVPVVKFSHPILASARELYDKQGGLQDTEWMREYGSVFGVYEGRTPSLFICEPDLVRLICIKDAEHFNGKRYQDNGDPLLNEMPDFLQPVEKWRVARAMATPAFTSAKMKMMNLPMREATLDFISDVKKKIGEGRGTHEKFAINKAVHTMLTDLISRSYFSVQIGGRDSGENHLARVVREAWNSSVSPTRHEIRVYSHAFPFLRKLFPVSLFDAKAMNEFAQIFKAMLDERRKSGQKRGDVVDLCLEWYEKLPTEEFQKAEINELTLLCQAFVFFAASQDQVSTMVATVIYHLTQDPELERRVYEEVDEAFAKNGGILQHEHFPHLTLLQACISECLRLYAVFHRTERVCTKDWKNEEYNLEVKKGTVIILPIWALNRNEKYTEDPDQFQADRWLPENKDKLNVFTSTAFGWGPRGCPGRRWATEVIPLILAYLIKELRFKKRKDTEILMLPGNPMMTEMGPIYVDVVERKNEK